MKTITQTIAIGQRVYCVLYGGKNGVIVAIHGDVDAASVRQIGGLVSAGGRAKLDIVWEDGSQARQVHESILRGVQWRLYDSFVSADVVAEYQTRAAIYTARKKAEDDSAAKARAIAKEQALAQGVAIGLIPEAEFRASGKRGSAAAHNLRAELKRAGIKASITQDGYNCLRVSVKNTEDAAKAKEISRKYKAGGFNSSEDIYEYNASAWGRVFGNVEYIF